MRWPDIRDRVFGRIDPISAGGRRYRADECPNVTLYQGHATFTGERELSVAPTDGSAATTVTADRIVIAAGVTPDGARGHRRLRGAVPHLRRRDAPRRPPRAA